MDKPGLIERVKQLVIGSADGMAAVGNETGQTGKSTSASTSDGPSAKDFLSRLSGIVRNRPNVLTGSVNLVGLERIRELLGAKWPHYAERAQDIATLTIRRSLGPDDVFLRYDDMKFLIVFAHLNREQAQAKCLQIAEEIAQKLLGEKFDESAAQVESGVLENSGEFIFSALDKQDLVRRLTSGAVGEIQVTSPDGVRTAPEPQDGIDLEPPDFSFARVDKAKALASMKIVFRPMWSPVRKVIATYFASPTAMNVFGMPLHDSDLRREYASVLTPLEFDHFVTRSVLKRLSELIAKGQRILICWPVDFETVATRQTRTAFLTLCQEVPDAIRQLLVFELDRMPAGTPQSRLVEVSTSMKPFCKAVFLRVPPEFRKGANLAASGISATGFALAPQGRDEEKIRLIEEFAEHCAKVGMRSYVRALTSRAQALAAIAAGIDFIDGPAVDEPADLPGPMRKFEIGDIYRKL